MQRRLTLILQRIILPQQSAFLPGRNIHHALLMVSEMLHQANQLREEHILLNRLLKLDVHKAFDTMDWKYILATAAKAGMNSMLSDFLKASFSSATLNIILKGTPTEPFRLARSVRQGCPLSPLIFILGFDNLSLLTNATVAKRELIGIQFPSQGLSHVISMYADDTLIIIRAELRFVWAVKATMDLFELALAFVLCGRRRELHSYQRAHPRLPSAYYPGLGKKNALPPSF